MRRIVAVLASAVLAASAGCGSTPGSTSTATGASPAATTGPSATAEPTATLAPTATATPDMRTLLENVAGGNDPGGSELDVVWKTILADVTHEGAADYTPPVTVTAYRGGEVPESACSRGTAARDWAENAFYCPADRSIFYDEAWFEDFSEATGRFAPAAIIAHEWGHHIENVLGYPTLSIQTELQADCFAGLFLANTIEALPGVSGSDADLEQALTTFFELGNSRYTASLWFRPKEHGSAQQRIRAFATGAAASFKSEGLPPPPGLGVATCYGYRDFTPEDYTDLLPYRLLNLPGRSELGIFGGYVIQPEDRLGFATSAVLLRWIPGTTQEILDAIATRFPGLTLKEPSIDLANNLAAGTGVANYAEQASPDLPGGARNGMFALVEPAAGGGALVIFVYRDGPALTEPLDEAGFAQLAEQIALLYEVIARTCGPDDSKVIGEPNLKLVCLTEQQ